MKTLFITFDYPPIKGGIARLLQIIINGMDSEEVVTVAPLLSTEKENFINHKGLLLRYKTIPEANGIHKIINFLAALPLILQYLFDRRVEKIHCTTVVRTAIFGLIGKYLFKKKIFLWNYGGETKSNFTRFKILSWFVRFSLKRADRLISISRFVTEELLAFGIDQKNITEIVLGVDFKEFFPQNKSPLLLNKYNLNEKLVVLTASRLVKRKGQDKILEIFSQLAGSYPDLHLLIVGDGPERENLEKLAEKLKIRQLVTFTGFQNTMALYYNLCDIFIMLNRKEPPKKNESLSIEGFGMVFIEAAACGKPVIGGKSGGTVFAIQHEKNGYLVDPENETEALNALKILVENLALRKKMGEEGINFAKNFDWEKSFKIISNL